MRTNNKVVFAALLGLAGCSTTDATNTQEVGGSREDLLDAGRGFDASNLRLWAVDRAGNSADLNTFDAARLVYLSVSRADRAGLVASGDLAFRVVDSEGAVMSKDVIDCRRFSVDERGMLDNSRFITGKTCRGTSVQLADGRVLLGIVPIRQAAADANGARKYRLEATRLAANASDDNVRYTMSIPFTVQPEVVPPPPVCGDGNVDPGEACDDGNTDDNDACHNDCSVCDGSDDSHHD